jgi:hypothetical protein
MKRTDVAEMLETIANTYAGKTRKEARLKRSIKVLAEKVRLGIY